jgi:hypothetical protein
MTTDELRDRLAVLCGWTKHPQGWWESPLPKGVSGFCATYHPFPPGDYNALIGAWPEGWCWERHEWVWRGWTGGISLRECDTGDEYADRLRLTVAVQEAEHGE